MNPVGLGTDAILEFYQIVLLSIMWIFLGTAWTAFAIYPACALGQWLLPRRAKKKIECGGEYEQRDAQ